METGFGMDTSRQYLKDTRQSLAKMVVMGKNLKNDIRRIYGFYDGRYVRQMRAYQYDNYCEIDPSGR